MCGVGQRLPDFLRRVTQFSDENERPFLAILLYLRATGRTRFVLLAIAHLSSPCLPFRWCWLIHTVEVAFERVYVTGPEATERSQPGIDLLKRLCFEPIQAALCVDGDVYEPGVAQHSQVFRYRRLWHSQLTLNVSDRLL
jgi:hypothetical protein